jgi:hypothetical protein
MRQRTRLARPKALQPEVTVTTGVRFRSVYADSNALWEVKRRRGSGVWLCEIVNEPFEIDGRMIDSDWNGHQDVFQEKDIIAAVRQAQLFEQLGRETDGFYASMVPGAVYHYHDSFGKFVRCKAVRTAEGMKLKPIALVGKWGKWDLPSRYLNGKINLPYHAKHVLEGGDDAAWQPSPSCVYESPDYSYKNEDDPRQMPAIDLTVPPMTAVEEAQAKLWLAVEEAQQALSDRENSGSDPAVRLRAALAVIQPALEGETVPADRPGGEE